MGKKSNYFIVWATSGGLFEALLPRRISECINFALLKPDILVIIVYKLQLSVHFCFMILSLFSNSMGRDQKKRGTRAERFLIYAESVIRLRHGAKLQEK